MQKHTFLFLLLLIIYKNGIKTLINVYHNISQVKPLQIASLSEEFSTFL